MDVGEYNGNNFILIQPGDEASVIQNAAHDNDAVVKPKVISPATGACFFRISTAYSLAETVDDPINIELVGTNGLEQAVDFVNWRHYQG